MAKRSSLSTFQPLASLREQCTALEASIAWTLGKPGKKPVHQLRTTTRRIEAHLELLKLLAAENDWLGSVLAKGGPAAKAAKLLREVRRSAGRVRDLDVQRATIREAAQEGRLRGEAKDLGRSLKAQRHTEAEALVEELDGHVRKLAPQLEKLLSALEPFGAFSISKERLNGIVADWHERHAQGDDASANGLHDARKVAKLARYMAEAGGVSDLAERFESLQGAGGEWHDALTLRVAAAETLGKKSRLARVFGEREASALRTYQAELAGFSSLSH